MQTSPDEVLQLDVVDRVGTTTMAALMLYNSVPARLAFASRSLLLDVEGEDLLACLIDLRRRLEVEGLNLCCQGARADVWPSGQLRQFTNGRFGYVLASKLPGEALKEVDLFASAHPHEIASIEQQREAVFRFHGLRQQRGIAGQEKPSSES
ncbi:hypothetical protein [Nonomuraea sp. NPDC049129]|uniref:hypothetical protein n=1 Tax=unclassified Nonomuraea TaxID=2593643 RepID=UPI0033E8F9A5